MTFSIQFTSEYRSNTQELNQEQNIILCNKGGENLKKIIIAIIAFLLIIALAVLTLFDKQESNLKSIKVAEVTHSVFFAPQYVP